MLSALIFDLDGTLLDTNDHHVEAWQQALEQHGYSVAPDRILVEIGKGGDKLVPALLGENAETQDGDALRQAHGACYEVIIQEREVRPFPEAADLLRDARERGLKVAIATASKEDKLDAVTERAGLDVHALADVVVTDTDVEGSKPEPDVVAVAVQKLGLSPAQCAMVGDTPYDVRAAGRGGVVTLGVLTNVHSRATMHRAGARALYADVADLRAHLTDALHTASPQPIALGQDLLGRLMDAALAEAERGLAEDQVPIGAVLARADGALVARARNEAKTRGTPNAHAELLAFLDAAGADLGEGAILATTLEPCVMCLGAALNAGVDTIVYALEAPPNGGIGRCEPYAGAPFPRFVGDVRRAESLRLLQRYRDAHPGAGFVRDLLASLDG